MPKMKAIVLHDSTVDNPEPWATMVEAGVKTEETRRYAFPKNYELPMPLVICASKDSRTDHAGKAVCKVDVIASRPMKPHHEKAAGIAVYDDAWAWQLDNLMFPSEKFEVAGRQRVFDLEVPEHITWRKPTPGELHRVRSWLLENNWIDAGQL